MRISPILISLMAAFAVSACAGKFEYTPPLTTPSTDNTTTIDVSKDELWNKIIPRLGKQFFVINNLDKDSGLINISYSGDPTRYIDCGHIYSYVKNARGERNYSFSAASPNESYEIMMGNLIFVNRKMSLEGRINVILESLQANKTRVTANTRYVLTKSSTVRDVQGRTHNSSDTINFNSGGSASFPNPGAKDQTKCVATGALEREILDLAK